MGVSTIPNRAVNAGDGSTKTFNFSYYFFNQADLVVYLYDTTTGAITPQILSTHYTVSGTQNAQGLYPSGGVVTFVTAPLATVLVVIFRDPARTSAYTLGQNGTISSSALTQQMDYLTLLVQRLEDQISRCIQLPDGLGATFNTQLPGTTALAPNAFIQVNPNGNGITTSASNPPFNLVTIPYTQLQTASTVIQTPLFTLPPATVLTGLFMKHSQAFSGVSITDVVAGIGVSGDYTKFINAFDIFQTVADQAFESVMAQYLGSWANPTTIYLQATATGANLSALSQGSLIVYYSYIFV